MNFMRTEKPPLIPPRPQDPQVIKAVTLMSFNELIDLKGQVDRELEHRGHVELSSLKEKLLTIAAMQGVSIGDLFAPPKPEKKPRKKRQPKVEAEAVAEEPILETVQ